VPLSFGPPDERRSGVARPRRRAALPLLLRVSTVRGSPFLGLAMALPCCP
jgi:hypothetical protein